VNGSVAKNVFRSGDLVPVSGIYLILHSTPHVLEQRELYVEGSHFPECKACPGGVRYRLLSPCMPMQARSTAAIALGCC
jgi:hypothetical protein